MADDDGGRPAVRLAIDNARTVAGPADEPPPWHDEGAAAGGFGAYSTPPPPRARDDGLPPGCPVQALGYEPDSQTAWYIDAAGLLVGHAPEKHTRLNLIAMFAPQSDYLHDQWPRLGPEGEKKGWKPELTQEALLNAARRRMFDPAERVRGRGAWLGPEGELLLHCGDVVLQGPAPARPDEGLRWRDPGLIDEHVYPVSPALLRPAETVDGADAAVQRLVAMLRTWAWQRGELDAHLALCWIGCGIAGGALPWRPSAWVTGGKGSGKSTLHDLLRGLCGPSGIVSVTDTSAAGVWQRLAHQTIPIAIDEAEPEAGDNRKLNNLVKLARQAASGGIVLRGGQDHRGVEFTMRSCFLFSSILVPPLLGQDASRLLLLRLGALPHGAPPPLLDPSSLRETGRVIRALLLRRWPRFTQALTQYRIALMGTGQTSRGADQYGALLAIGDLLTGGDSEVDSDTAVEWATRLADAFAAEQQGSDEDEDKCLGHLLSSVIDPYRRGVRKPLADWIAQAAGMAANEPEHEAREILASYGLKVLGELTPDPQLAVANRHAGLHEIFAGTHWYGSKEAGGGWVQSLQRLRGAARSDGVVRFGRFVARATLLPLSSVLPGERRWTAGDPMFDNLREAPDGSPPRTH